jgi:hypothetical protein
VGGGGEYVLCCEQLASLAGQGSYHRVLKLRSPFGGGKSHTLASLLHSAKSRKSLNQIAECKKLADPGTVDVADFFRFRWIQLASVKPTSAGKASRQRFG